MNALAGFSLAMGIAATSENEWEHGLNGLGGFTPIIRISFPDLYGQEKAGASGQRMETDHCFKAGFNPLCNSVKKLLQLCV